MKPSTFKALSFLLSFLGSFGIIFFGFPLWAFFLLIPGLVYSQLLFSNRYTFRESLTLEPIPATGYEKRLNDLESNQPFLTQLGFVKFDEFYMQTSNDLVAFAFKHQTLPIIALEYHFESVRTIDFNTKFENDLSVTTTNFENAYILERSNTKLFQNFPELSFRQLFDKHIEAIEFLKQQGFEQEDCDRRFFRQRFLESYLEFGRKYRGLLSPITALYRFFFEDKYKYRKTIQEQFLARSFQLPEPFTAQKALPWRQ